MPAPVIFDVETSLSPETVRTALLDFTDRRPQLWPGLSEKLYKVYSVGPTEAEIQEGTASPGMEVWARERYDWSKPGVVRWTVVHSNFSAPGSYVQATFHDRPGGGARITIEWNRTGSNFKGRLMVGLIRLIRAQPVKASFEMALRRMEESQGHMAATG